MVDPGAVQPGWLIPSSVTTQTRLFEACRISLNSASALLDRDSLRRDGTLWPKLQEVHSSLTTVGVVDYVPCSTPS
jgi:hypothetical protein